MQQLHKPLGRKPDGGGVVVGVDADAVRGQEKVLVQEEVHPVLLIGQQPQGSDGAGDEVIVGMLVIPAEGQLDILPDGLDGHPRLFHAADDAQPLEVGVPEHTDAPGGALHKGLKQ